MKSILKVTLWSLLSMTSIKAQNITCQDLLEFVIDNGRYKGEVSSITLINSSWLKSVKAYEYKGKVYVIAEIKDNEYSYQTSTYIFCGIPLRNWDNFENYFSDTNLSYGQKFHKYIINYKCNCS
jgi:hypothetical protein